MNSSRVQRIHVFLHERFPIFPHQILVFVAFAVNFVALTFLFSNSQWNWLEFSLGGITFVSLSLLMRVADDLKDFKADGTYFPDRPSQTGKIREKDLLFFLGFLFALVLVLNAGFIGQPTWTSILVTLLFCFLLYKWLFLEKFIRPNLLLAFLTHNPIVLFFQYYTLSFFMDGEYSRLAISFLIGDALITSAWEVARKIRGTTEENEYSTYSKVLGIYGSTILMFGFVCASFCLSFYAIYESAHFLWGMLIPASILGFLAFKVLSFWREPSKGQKFREFVELYKVSFIAAIIITVCVK